MPFKSVAQQKYMFLKHPKLAQEMADKTKDFSKLPKRVGQLEALKRKSK